MVWMLGAITLTTSCHAHQSALPHSFPEDLFVRGTVGSLVPGGENQVAEIRATGRGRFARVDPSELGPLLEDVAFDVSNPQLEALWAAIQQSDFYSLDSFYTAGGVDDGAFAVLSVTADGRSHQVKVKNASVPRFEELLRAVSRITPEGKDLHYVGLEPDR